MSKYFISYMKYYGETTDRFETTVYVDYRLENEIINIHPLIWQEKHNKISGKFKKFILMNWKKIEEERCVCPICKKEIREEKLNTELKKINELWEK